MPELKLRRCNKYMFQTVKCSKYMRKINDGKCITLLTGDETENGKPAYFYTDYSEKKEKDRFREVPAEDWGGGDFMKTYYLLVCAHIPTCDDSKQVISNIRIILNFII